MGKRLSAVLSGCALIAGMLVAGGPASASHSGSYDIIVGQELEGTSAESMRFLPDRLTVHQGDLLNFVGGFHTATMLPVGTDPDTWTENENHAPGDPYFLVAENPDDDVMTFKANNGAVFPSDPACGPPTTPCSYDGSAVVHSGIMAFTGPFSATVDAAPGSVFWVLCTIHPNMRMKVTVVEDEEAPSDPSGVAEVVERTIENDLHHALALTLKLERPSSHMTDGGKRVWDAFAGYDTAHLSFFDMFPGKLKIEKGDSVQFYFAELWFEDHTASFPRNAALGLILNDFVPSCDLDGDAGTAPNEPPVSENPPFCADPAQLELLINGATFDRAGDGVYDGSASDFESSGARGALVSGVLGPENDPWRVRFSKVSGKKGYAYICMIHPFMRGKVVVRKP